MDVGGAPPPRPSLDKTGATEDKGERSQSWKRRSYEPQEGQQWSEDWKSQDWKSQSNVEQQRQELHQKWGADDRSAGRHSAPREDQTWQTWDAAPDHGWRQPDHNWEPREQRPQPGQSSSSSSWQGERGWKRDWWTR